MLPIFRVSKQFLLAEESTFLARGVFNGPTRKAASLIEEKHKDDASEFTPRPFLLPSSFPPPPPPSAFAAMIHARMDADHAERGIDRVGEVAKYYFDGKGKAIRPTLTFLMSQAVNERLGIPLDSVDYERLRRHQLDIGLCAEILHTASLYHDDVLDAADLRRMRTSVNHKFGENAAVAGGAYACALALGMAANTGDEEVTQMVAGILDTLVTGELQQADKKNNNNKDPSIYDSDVDLFINDEEMQQDGDFRRLCQRYLTKSYNKTASLMALSCKAVATLAVKHAGIVGNEVPTLAFEFGRDLGLCFQMVDDAMDFEADAEQLGKPAGADLRLGLATAPLLLSVKQFPAELRPMADRRFSHSGDPERAFELVVRSKGPLLARRAAERFAGRAEERLMRLGLLSPGLEELVGSSVGRLS